MEAYKIWHALHQKFPRLSKYTLGLKIETLFTDLIESLLLASYATGHEKGGYVHSANAKLDALKYFLQIGWELKCLDHNGYAELAAPLAEVGKMIGGWMRHLTEKNAPPA